MLPGTGDDDRQRICVQVLRDLQHWLPERAVPRIFSRLHTMQAIQSAQPNRVKKTVSEHIQKQVAGIVTRTTDDMSRLSLLFWPSQLASTVDAAQIEDGTPMTVGRGRVSVLFDQFVEAEFASHEEYEQAKEERRTDGPNARTLEEEEGAW